MERQIAAVIERPFDETRWAQTTLLSRYIMHCSVLERISKVDPADRPMIENRSTRFVRNAEWAMLSEELTRNQTCDISMETMQDKCRLDMYLAGLQERPDKL